MPLGAGAKLGPYEVLAPLGAGGMGEVYRAKDTRLDRTVAIKVLPQHLSSNPASQQRFEREARAVSSLNHPHICTLHDVGHQDGVDYIVMELVEGETLLDRLKKSPLPLDQTLRYGIEIADALDKAHRHGVIHRDLKPGNVMLTKAGSKLMDFGLAKQGPEGNGGGGVSAIPTQEEPLTQAGSLLGTYQYMSPEQFEGEDADARADIWALGCVLYEMATGRRAFEGTSRASLIGSILKDEPPPIAKLQPMAPPAFDRLVKLCLAKDPDERWQNAHDVVAELRWVLEGGSGAATPEAARRRRRERLAWISAAVVGALALVGWAMALWVPLRRSAAPAPPLRLSVGLGADVSLAAEVSTGAGSAAILSPDGGLLAFVARKKEGGRPQLFLRRLDRLHAAPLPGTDGARSPFFSPDGQWIAFFAEGKLKRVAVSGGAAVALADAPNDRGGTWSEDGTILFVPISGPGVSLSRVPAGGGPTEVLTRPDLAAGEVTHRWPQALPGGKAVLFTANHTLGTYDDASIVVQTLPSGPRKVVATGGYHGRYLSSGHLVYMHEGTLFAVPFDLARLEALGAAVPVIEELVGAPRTAAAQFAVSSRGSLVYLPGRGFEGKLTVHWLDRSGKLTPLLAVPGQYSNLQFSPDGTKLAMEVYESNRVDIWVYEWGQDTMSRLTFDVIDSSNPVWAPDGRNLAFGSSGGTQLGHIYWQRADGTGTPQTLTESKNVQTAASWHPSGRYIAFEDLSAQTGYDVMILPVERDAASGLKPGQPTPFLKSPSHEWQAAFSPDGRWLAYSSNESGNVEVYVRPFPGPGGKWQISTGGGFWPTWSPNGREVFFETPDQTLMVVSYREQGGSFLADRPRLWCETRIPTQQGLRGFDLHPDGRRLAVFQDVAEPGDAKRDQVVLFQNFFDELRRLAPAK